jgi:phospholipid transport system substrate-binding protein
MNFSRSRRAILAGLMMSALLPMACARAAEDPAVASIRSFYDNLQTSMKRVRQSGVSSRYDGLAPAIRETFDFHAMTRLAVGTSWTSLPSAQQSALIEAFERLTIATYASRFEGYSAARFEVEPNSAARGSHRIVRTRMLHPSGGHITALNFLTREAGSDWKVVDVYLDGTVSEIATRRSEFTSILNDGGADALLDRMRERTDKLIKGPEPR